MILCRSETFTAQSTGATCRSPVKKAPVRKPAPIAPPLSAPKVNSHLLRYPKVSGLRMMPRRSSAGSPRSHGGLTAFSLRFLSRCASL